MSSTLANGEEIIDLDAAGAGTIINNNAAKRNEKLQHIMSATEVPGQTAVSDVAATTANTLGFASGTASTTVPEPGATYDETTMQDIIKSLVTEINALRDDRENDRNKINELLATLRKTGGCGVIADNP